MPFDEEKYNKLRDSLRSLPKVRARNDFEARLHKRIAEHESLHDKVFKPEREAKRGSWMDILAGLLRPSYAPAIGLAVVLLLVVVVYFAYYNEMTNDKQELLESTQSIEQKRDELVIYVRDENGNRVLDESARDLALSEDVRQPSPIYPTPETSTDAFARPEEYPGTVSDEKEEMKLEMEKDSPKPEERRTETKGDDGIYMKKSGKIEGKESPFNIRKEDTGDKSEQEMNKQDSNEEINQQTDEIIQRDDDTSRLARSRKDSLRVKDKELEEQKDSMEK